MEVHIENKTEFLDEHPQVDTGLGELLAKLFLVFGGVAPYIPQYLQIRSTQDASGFSTLVCFIVIMSNVLRISYWFGHWFDNALLWQSIVMTIVMFAVLELCLRTARNRARAEGETIKESRFSDFDLEKFWQWTDLFSYVQVTLGLLLLTTSYTTLFADYDILIEPVGFIALLIESALAIPQFLKNYENGTTNGMNIYMVLLWTLGDTIKGFFFFHTEQPFPFRMCATIQLLVDGALFYQVAAYD